jgi:DNA-directed RNA polymerase specialized sigma24 family protein
VTAADAPQIDPLLQRFVDSQSPAEIESLLERLIRDHAEPLIRKTIRRRSWLSHSSSSLASPERNAEDICNDACLHVLRSLRHLKAQPEERPIRNFHAYVRTIAYQACDQQLREMRPLRWRLKNQVRYLLSHHPEFALWETEESEWIAGEKSWSKKPGLKDASLLQEIVSTLSAANISGTARLIKLLRDVFSKLQQPVELDELVTALERPLGIFAQGVVDASEDVVQNIADKTPAFELRYEQRTYLRKLWQELTLLPPAQRTAILLSLREPSGRTVLPLFPLLEIATVGEIAKQVALPEFRFTELWKELPLEDYTIANLLSLTRQQVINLRKSARLRLGRRMKLFESGGNPRAKSPSLHNKGK